MLSPSRKIFAFLVSRADAARDGRRFAEAAALYEEAAHLRPGHAGMLVQAGNMRKEAGDFASAEQNYLRARALRPDDADLAVQFGHLYKLSGRFAEARRAYDDAVRLRPDWGAARNEAAALAAVGVRDAAQTAPDPLPFGTSPAAATGLGAFSAAEIGRLPAQLAPRPPADLLTRHHDWIFVHKLGRKEDGFWGKRRTLRGVEAVHGWCVSERPLVEVEVLLNGFTVHRGRVKGGYRLSREIEPDRILKYVYNEWIDFSDFAPGLHALELRFTQADEASRSHHEQVVIADPLPETLAPGVDALIELDPANRRSLEEQVRTRPSQVHEAKRELFPDGIRTVLVARTDQLGDMVASIPAMQRLRELVPGAHIVGLLTPANAELARTLDVFDEVIAIDFPDDPVERRRLMPLAAQEELRRRLEPYRFDLAIDLARAGISRDLLRLADAKFCYGVGGEDWPWMNGEIIFNTRNRWADHDITPHSAKVLALVEALGTVLKTTAPIIRRPELGRAQLEQYGLPADARYVVLHLGARIGFSRWPYYAGLASMLLDRTDVRIVAITEDPAIRGTLPPELIADERFLLLDRRLPFDDFDAFLHFASVMVGNDSGPKHLASLRGVDVVTLFSARINWQEWGQENKGVIITRKVPCAGCALLHEPENCGKDFACIVDIRTDEVFAQVMRYLGSPAEGS